MARKFEIAGPTKARVARARDYGMKNTILLNEKHHRCSFYIDATFKLMNNGFGLLTLGTETINHNLLLIACVISAHECNDMVTPPQT